MPPYCQGEHEEGRQHRDPIRVLIRGAHQQLTVHFEPQPNGLCVVGGLRCRVPIPTDAHVHDLKQHTITQPSDTGQTSDTQTTQDQHQSQAGRPNDLRKQCLCTPMHDRTLFVSSSSDFSTLLSRSAHFPAPGLVAHLHSRKGRCLILYTLSLVSLPRHVSAPIVVPLGSTNCNSMLRRV